MTRSPILDCVPQARKRGWRQFLRSKTARPAMNSIGSRTWSFVAAKSHCGERDRIRLLALKMHQAKATAQPKSEAELPCCNIDQYESHHAKQKIGSQLNWSFQPYPCHQNCCNHRGHQATRMFQFLSEAMHLQQETCAECAQACAELSTWREFGPMQRMKSSTRLSQPIREHGFAATFEAALQ